MSINPPWYNPPPKRGEIYFLFLDPSLGREAGGYKVRPVVVLSINDLNKKPLVITVVPGTSVKENAPPRRFPNVIRIRSEDIVQASPEEAGLDCDTYFECHQLRAIDHGRFTGRSVGRLSSDDLQRIEEGVKYCLGFD